MSSKFNPELEDFVLEINTGLTKLIHPSITEEASIVPTEELALAFFQSKNKGSDILPPVVRAISADYTWIMLERPPQEYKIYYTTKYKWYDEDYEDEGIESEEHQYSIKMPWIVYVLNFSDTTYTYLKHMFVYGKNGQIGTEDEILYRLCLPNLYQSGEVCLEDVAEQSLNKANIQDMGSAINVVIDSFWHSNFNRDAGEMSEYKYIEYLESFEKQTLEEAVDMEMKPSDIADIIIGDYHDRELVAPSIQTVGEWISMFDRQGQVTLNHLPNPFLAFVNSILGR